MGNGGKLLRLGGVFAATWVIAISAAVAQTEVASSDETAPPAEPGDEIIVTATKRSKSVLDVPISISVFDSKSLTEKNVRNLEELARSVPGVVIVSGGENAPTVFSVRGVGPEFNTAATVAIYVDDTPITIGTNSPDLKIFDVDRVEVLKGPQGTLFGSSAMGGAIRYVAPRPSYDEVSGRVMADLSTTAHGGQNYEVQGAIGAPIASNLGLRASGFYRRDGGYIDVVDDHTGDVVNRDANSSDSFGGRIALGARVSPSAEAILSVIYQDTKLHDLNFMHSVRQSGGVLTPLERYQKTERVNLSNRERFFLPNLLVNVDLGSARLTSSTSLQRQRVDLVNDGSYFIQGLFGAPPELGDQIVDEVERTRRFNAFVQEVRLASDQSGTVEWLVGGYYRRSKLTSFQTFGSNLESVFGFPDFLFLEDGAIETFDQSSKVTELAAFGEASVNITKALKVTAGLRYSKLTRKVDEVEILGPLLGPNPAEVHETSREKPITPKLAASYDFGSAMVYASTAKGFREGGPNAPLFMSDACVEALAALGLDGAPTSFDSDALWSHELGAKGRTAGNRVTFQGSVYQINWSNIQQSIALGAQCGNSPVANFGEARIRGAELDLNFKPLHGLDLAGSVNYYFEAELTEDRVTGTDSDGEPVVGAVAGTPLSFVPSFTAAASARYEWPISVDMNAYVRADIQHVGAANRFIETTGGANPSLRAGSYQVASARLGLLTRGMEISLFADNLFDAHPILAEGGGFAPGENLGVARTTIRPRTIGINLAKNF